MDQRNALSPPELLGEETTFLGNYRRRVHWIGKIQLAAATIYLIGVVLFQVFLMPGTSLTSFNTKYTVFNKTDNQTLGTLTITVTNPALDAAFYKLNFWMALNAIRAVIHILSSILLLWATKESTAKLTAKIFCYCSRVMNLTFFLYEIVVFVFMYQQWEFAIFFTLYRIWFDYEVRGFLNKVLVLAPPPPGHHC